uniref:Uncharacterized protein n=1 Tax=Siphoviridae sp. ctiOl67 TaxID=2825622 RepID=A0A8S5QJI2_9CAUD|nr:MAG TPA: hypothetical protein [Siphoviridae sp. ctiOl67]
MIYLLFYRLLCNHILQIYLQQYFLLVHQWYF